jgi:hypothetical protein
MRKIQVSAVAAHEVNEEVLNYTVDFTMKSVSAIVGTLENGEVTSHRLVNLGREGFDMLMSESPAWAVGKPKDNFRRQDIFSVLDIMGL